MIKSAQEFIHLRSSQDPKEYRRAATDSAPEPVWMDLIEQFPEMRRWVALNKTLPQSVLWKLVHDSSPIVRTIVADRHQLTAEMFAALAKDSDEGVRARVAWNKKAPQEIVNQLSLDVSSIVAEAASRRIKWKRRCD
jgi:hypothetical protein